MTTCLFHVNMIKSDLRKKTILLKLIYLYIGISSCRHLLLLIYWTLGCSYLYKAVSGQFPKSVKNSNKKSNLSFHLILFFPFCCCFASSLQFSLWTVKCTKLLQFNFQEKTWKNITLDSDWTFHFSVFLWKTLFIPLTFRLELICVHMKIYNIAFHWVYLIMYIK